MSKFDVESAFAVHGNRKPKLPVNVAFNYDALMKAKDDFERLAGELIKTSTLARDPQWLNGVERLILKATEEFEQQKTVLKTQLDTVEKEQREGVRTAVLEVLQKSNQLDGTFEEIKVLLGQIFRVVTSDAELKRHTLENINAELNR